MASTIRVVTLTEKQSVHTLGWKLQYLEDRQGQWSLADVSSGPRARQFIDSETDVPNFGFTASTYWFRVAVQSELNERRKYLLEIPYPVLDHFELYIEKVHGEFVKYVAGDTHPNGNKLIKHANFLFPLYVGQGERKQIYLRVRTSGSLQAPILLWTIEAFLAQEHDRQLMFGLFFGLSVVMILYNLFLFLAIRDHSYLYYVLFVTCFTLFEATFTGIAQEYLWPGSPWFANNSFIMSIFGANLFAYLFTKEFLDLKQILPRWSRIFRGLIIIAVIGLVLTPALPYRYMILVAANLSNIGVIFSLIVSFMAWRRGFRPARYHLLSWSAFYLGIGFLALSKLGVLPRTLLTENSHLIGTALNIILLSLALGERINVLRKDKEQARARALEIQRQAAETLEQEVERKTQDLKQRTQEAEGAREELRVAYERLAEHDRLKSRFFANVSHEVRTPLTLILTPLEHILGGQSGPVAVGVMDKLVTMQRNVQRLLRQVNQMLDFSRLESGGTTVSYELVNIKDYVTSVSQAFEAFTRSKGLALHLRGGDELPTVWTDPTKLEKILSNLLANACKFTEAGGSVIVRLSGDDASVTVSVRDTGIGISEEELPHVFERFRQVESSTSRRYGGTGIGLALSKELAELIGAELAVESELGAGSTFSVRLPLGKEHIQEGALLQEETRNDEGSEQARRAAEALAAEVVASSTEEKIQDTGEWGAPKPLVLVVEDNPDMRQLLVEICQEEFSVMQAANGKQGLEQTERHRPALVISDVMMPEMDGYELLRCLRQTPDTASIPVILLTAKAGPQMRLEGLESGADDYLSKPFESRELLARAKNLIRLQRQERELRELNARLQQEVLQQATELERARMLGRYLPQAMVRAVLEGGQSVEADQDRLRLTVFRLQLRGFGELVENMASEDVTAMLNSYLSEMSEVAFAHGATVEKFVRDTVMGFFGAPISEGVMQDALRCARMAVEMWQRAGQICQRWRRLYTGPSPAPTMVLASGYATVGSFGSSNRLDYTAVGGPSYEAETMLPYVKTNEVDCCQSTWGLVKEEMEAAERHMVIVGPHQQEISLFRLAGGGSPEVGEVEETRPIPTQNSPWEALRAQEEVTPSQSPKLTPGTMIADRYRVIERLGKGGMGTVYRVLDVKLDVEQALKLLHFELRDDSHALERFYQEVRLARQISHDSVARLHDIDAWKGREFITMEYIEGETLEQRLQERGPLPLVEGHAILLKLCAGLGAAHGVGVVHRDLKPANIMLTPGDRVVILDFGIATFGATTSREGTHSEGVIGTPYYMAPEQFEGEKATVRSDLYSLGVVAFEMFTGKRPFVAKNVIKVARLHVSQAPPDLQQLRPDLPPRLTAVIQSCLAKDPVQRFASAGEMSSILLGITVGD